MRGWPPTETQWEFSPIFLPRQKASSFSKQLTSANKCLISSPCAPRINRCFGGLFSTANSHEAWQFVLKRWLMAWKSAFTQSPVVASPLHVDPTGTVIPLSPVAMALSLSNSGTVSRSKKWCAMETKDMLGKDPLCHVDLTGCLGKTRAQGTKQNILSICSWNTTTQGNCNF